MSVIVVGVDFTPCSASGLSQATRIAAGRRATVQAVHAIEPLVVEDLEQALRPKASTSVLLVKEPSIRSRAERRLFRGRSRPCGRRSRARRCAMS